MDNGIASGWHKSRRSSGGNCVEVRRDGDRVLMRDSKDRSGPVLAFDVEEFRNFIADLKDGTSIPSDQDSD
ncbi:DUF397 domain-containing protein [Paractinoplanes rishiriensis]|uniref:DUF397 domain-containing protein n=1 Tax=Paractinoplanes rishiriensis TaxID=1050105 RepID=UPI001EF300E5|nr:DUF397 domain-containing protein [Actinoplanes rishiriensis]